MGPEVHSAIHERVCQGGVCGASSNEETKKNMDQERHGTEIPLQRNQIFWRIIPAFS